MGRGGNSDSAVGTLKRMWGSWGDNVDKLDKKRLAELAKQNSTRIVEEGEECPVLTRAEVAKHCTPEDCWVIVKNRVYNLSGWVDHPGGQVVFTQAGRDATDMFHVFHSPAAWTHLRRFLIGKCEEESVPADGLLTDYRKLREQFRSWGLFKASAGFYVWKTLSTLALALVSAAVLVTYGPSSWLAVLAAALVMGVFWQQCGWLAHDYLHNQVFENRRLNHIVGGLVVGNLWQGYSAAWWKNKHNTHHAVPNEITPQDFKAVDPDIDTMPILAWDADMLSSLPKEQRGFIRQQTKLMFPILCLARANWQHQSYLYASGQKDGRRRHDEMVFIYGHYAWVLALLLFAGGPLKALTFYAIATCVAGLLIAWVFVQSHNDMQFYTSDKSQDFATNQILTTRNFDCLIGSKLKQYVVDWFAGGLNMQIEHHLFPTMPRHNLRRTAPYIRAMCCKHNLGYVDYGLVAGTKVLLDKLHRIALAA